MSKRKLWCMILLAGQTIQPYNFETTCFLCYNFYLYFLLPYPLLEGSIRKSVGILDWRKEKSRGSFLSGMSLVKTVSNLVPWRLLLFEPIKVSHFSSIHLSIISSEAFYTSYISDASICNTFDNVWRFILIATSWRERIAGSILGVEVGWLIIHDAENSPS